MARKTQTIDEIVTRANEYLRITDADMRGRRQGVIPVRRKTSSKWVRR